MVYCRSPIFKLNYSSCTSVPQDEDTGCSNVELVCCQLANPASRHGALEVWLEP